VSSLQLDIQCQGENDFTLDLKCQLPAAGITAIYGPSGSGKSTLLDCIAGLRKPSDSSVIALNHTRWHAPGRCVPPWRRGIGYVFQDARLFPHLDTLGNLKYPLARNQPGSVTLDQVINWLELHDMLAHRVDTLSAGQKQRVAIGRALLGSPELLLLDEPLANLDHVAASECLRCLQHLSANTRIPMLYVSHNIEEVCQLADHLLLLESGRVTEQGSLLDLCSRLDTRLCREEQAAAIITGTISGQDEAFGLTELDIDGHILRVSQLRLPAGQSRRIRIPARDVSICRERPRNSSILNIFPVTIEELEDTTAPRLLLRLSLGRQYLLARITRRSAVELGLQKDDEVYAQIKSAALLTGPTDAV